MTELELQGKTALVTGASKGIGKASALKLASMGANIAVNYFSSENEMTINIYDRIFIFLSTYYNYLYIMPPFLDFLTFFRWVLFDDIRKK